MIPPRRKVTIRRAVFKDLPAIREMVEEAFQRSSYSPVTQTNEKLLNSNLMTAIQRHGVQRAGGTFVVVADNGEGLEGVVIGLLQPLYHILEELEATDVLWYTRLGANPFTALRLLRAMHKWVPEGAYIRQGNSSAIMGADKVSGKILSRMKMRPVGTIYEKRKT